MFPPPDSGYAVGWVTHFSIERLTLSLANIWKAYVPLPLLTLRFWGYMGSDNILPSLFLQCFFSTVLLVASLFLLSDHPTALFQFIIANIGIIGFAYIKDFGFARHYGHLYILFIAVIWICNSEPTSGSQSVKIFKSLSIEPLRNAFVTFILFVQVASVIHPIWTDWRHPFSSSKEVVDFIESNEMAEMTMASDRDWSGVPVAGYLGKELYFPRTNRFGRFIVWDKTWANSVSAKQATDHVLDRVEALAQEKQEDILLILDYELSDKQMQLHSLSMLMRSQPSIVPDETYYVYLLKMK